LHSRRPITLLQLNPMLPPCTRATHHAGLLQGHSRSTLSPAFALTRVADGQESWKLNNPCLEFDPQRVPDPRVSVDDNLSHFTSHCILTFPNSHSTPGELVSTDRLSSLSF